MATLSQAETFDKVVRMVIIGHHFARRLPLRVAGSSSTTATAKLTMHLIAASKHQRCAVRDARGLEPARPPIKCLPCSPSCVYLIHGPYTSQVSAHTRFRAMRDFSICRRSQQHCPPPAQRRARVKFLWCAVFVRCALSRLLRRSGCRSDADGAGRGGWVRFRSRCPRS